VRKQSLKLWWDGKYMQKKKMVFIIGGGKTGAYLAGLLLKSGCDVRVLEHRPQMFEKLVKNLPKNMVILGDGTDPTILEQAGIANANVLAAVTGSDETNLVAATLAKFEYQVERVIMRVNNPRNAWLCTPEMGVDVALNQSDFMASLIVEEMSVGDMMTLVRLRQGAVEIVEERIAVDSKAANRPLSALGLPTGCNITAVIRGSSVIVPNGSTILEAGDEILAVVQRSQREALQLTLA
jgi:trk/ktr system potassium uptake protein